jgi:hypothetical protein
MKPARNVMLVDESFDRRPEESPSEEVPVSYAEAKEIALLRLELRACWDRQDHTAARAALDRMAARAGNDNELAAEVRRWSFRFA